LAYKNCQDSWVAKGDAITKAEKNIKDLLLTKVRDCDSYHVAAFSDVLKLDDVERMVKEL